MPRARINAPEEEIVPRKTRVSKSRVSSVGGEETSPKPRKRATPKPRVVVDEVPEMARKAPTQVAARRRLRSRNSKMFFGVGAFCFVLVGLGVGVGFLDRGEINVVAVVNERNEKINKGEIRDEKTGEKLTQTVPVQNIDSRPNGGLQIADPSSVPAPVIESVATSTDTASTTNETATTSSEVEPPETTPPAL